ncbi:hypothetical protein [Streptomyces mirabilis]
MTQLTVHTRATSAGPVIELYGELDNDSAPDVRTLLPRLTLQAGQQLVLPQATFALLMTACRRWLSAWRFRQMM